MINGLLLKISVISITSMQAQIAILRRLFRLQFMKIVLIYSFFIQRLIPPENNF